MTELNLLAKDYWTNVYVPLMNTDTPLKAQFGRLENAMFTGRTWIFGVKSNVGGGAANVGANKSLPAATAGQYNQGSANLVRTYVRMAIDGLAIEVTKKQQGSFRPALAEVMADRLAQHDLEVNRQLFCAGTGVTAKVVVGGTSGTTQTLVLDYGVAGAGTRHIYAGDQIEFMKADLATSIGKRTVVSVDQSANTVVVDSTIDTTVGGGQHVVTHATADTNNIAAGEVNGLLASVSDAGPFEGINATAATRWKSYRATNAGTVRPLTDGLAVQTVEVVRARSRLLPKLCVTRPGVVLKYSESFLPLRRIAGQDVQLKGGYKPITGIQCAGAVIPVMDDLDCPDNRIFFLNPDSFKMADLVGSEWAELDGAQFFRVQDKDAIEGYIRKYWQLITTQRNANAVIEDVEDIAAIDKIAA